MLSQELIDAEATAFIGVGPFERPTDCTALRNGTRARTLTTTAGDRDRTLTAQEFPYVFLDATYCKARVGRRIVSQAIVVAVGVAADGRREVLGFDVGDSENEGFWTAFLRSLKTRGLNGVKLVMSDAHTGLKKAIGAVFQGAG